jgi:hypothetical protein
VHGLHEPALQTGVASEHAAHAPPPVPHVAEDSPGTQVVPSQQPPLQGPAPVHAAPHRPEVHALYAGQSVAAPQPQVPPGRHALPPALPTQLAHAPPEAPHAP